MRALAGLLTAIFWIYLVAIVATLGIGLVGLASNPPEPLALVFAITLALPWSLLIGSPPGTTDPVGSVLLLLLFMSANAALLQFAARAARRTAG